MIKAIVEHMSLSIPNSCPVEYPPYMSRFNGRPLTLDAHMYSEHRNKPTYIPHIRWPYTNVTYYPITEDNNQYFYIINLYNVMYFHENKDYGFSGVNRTVINDTHTDKCKIIIIMDVEGTSGETGTVTEQDFVILTQWCIDVNINVKNVHYISGNLIADITASKYDVLYNIHPVTTQETWNWYYTSDFKDPIPTFSPINDKYLYLSYNRQSRTHRVILLSKLIKQNLLNNGMVSFNTMGREFAIFAEPLEMAEPGLSHFGEQLFKMAPLFADVDNTDITSSLGDISNYYNTFVSVVTETLTGDGVLFCSEKTWRAVIVGHPFMILGSCGTLRYLRSQGFKTFSDWFDESYDENPDVNQRINIIVNNLLKLKTKSISELSRLSKQMLPTIIHNRDVFRQRCLNKYYHNKLYIHKKPVEDILSDIWNTWGKS